MRFSSPILRLGGVLTLALASPTSPASKDTLTRPCPRKSTFEVTDYISDTIGSFSYYTFSISYTPCPSSNVQTTTSQPAFNTTSCNFSTDDDFGTYVACDDGSVTTTGDFSSGDYLELTVKHTWTIEPTAVSPGGTASVTAQKQVPLYLGSGPYPADFKMEAAAPVFVAAAKQGKKVSRDELLRRVEEERRGRGAREDEQ